MLNIRTLLAILLLCVLSAPTSAIAQTPTPGDNGKSKKQTSKHWSKWQTVKIAAAQVSIHTGTEGDEMVAFIDRAGSDGAQLIVLGEYILGTFPSQAPMKSERVRRVSEASRRNQIYVVVGGWEEFEPGAVAALKPRAFANTAIGHVEPPVPPLPLEPGKSKTE